MLSEGEYAILRQSRTEEPFTSALWNNEKPGTYRCRGCDLTLFDGRFKVILDKGWVFFTYAQTNAVLLSVEGPVPEYGDMAASNDTMTEVHCRRCGSHLGHYVVVAIDPLHCINGTALVFHSQAA